jgi:hypothetical protein
MTINKQDVIDHLWERRANEYVLNDERETFKLDDVVNFTHRHQIFDKDLHDVSFKLQHMLERSITCPICQPKTQHDYGVQVLRDYFKNKLQLADSEVQERVIQTDDGHAFDFLIFDSLVVHYFDSSYYKNFTKESDEMMALLAEFTDSDDYDLLPVTYNDITMIIAGGDLELDMGDDDEHEYQ